MEQKNKKEINLAPHGCVTEIAKLTGYSRTTITRALRNNTNGVKAEKVREIFRKKYM
jgi:DNA-binding phage protein